MPQMSPLTWIPIIFLSLTTLMIKNSIMQKNKSQKTLSSKMKLNNKKIMW